MTSPFKECGCQGRNPNCVRCSGFGLIRPQDKIRAPYVAGPPVQIKTSRSKPKKCSTLCPFCKSPVTKMLRHVKKVHPERLLEFQGMAQRVRPAAKEVAKPQLKSKPEKILITCPYCRSPVTKMLKHVKKAHPERLLDFQRVVQRVKPATKEIVQPLRKTKPKKILIPCLYCKSPVPNMLTHIEEAHSERLLEFQRLTGQVEPMYKKTVKTEPSRKRITGKRILIREAENKKSVEKKKVDMTSKEIAYKDKKRIKDIRLENRMGDRYISLMVCSACGVETQPTWQFMATNGKEVIICSRCKPTVFERSFDKKDALDYAFLGGMFEGNRRRH